MIPLIAVAFLCLAGPLLWFCVGARGYWPLKLALILVVTLYAFVVWHALGSFTGWPTKQAMPKRCLYVASVVVEPDKDQDGATYVWCISPDKGGLLEYKPGVAEPRAYRLPYERPTHEQLENANKMQAKGIRVELRGDKPGTGGELMRRARFRAYELPPVGNSRKGAG